MKIASISTIIRMVYLYVELDDFGVENGFYVRTCRVVFRLRKNTSFLDGEVVNFI